MYRNTNNYGDMEVKIFEANDPFLLRCKNKKAWSVGFSKYGDVNREM